MPTRHNSQLQPADIRTLAIDVGGTGLKAILLNSKGRPISERQRVDTPRPATTEAVLAAIDGIVKPLGDFDRASVGFPGVVKRGVTYTAHNLDPSWIGFDLERVLARKWKRPVRVANDAAVQGYAAIRGRGVELVITLGTGLGSSLFTDGHLVAGLELAHHPWKKKLTYEDFLGRKGLQKYGRKRWNKQVEKAIEQIEALFNYDHLYIGGGNATKIDFPLPSKVTRVPNDDGLLGGVALWRDELHISIPSHAQPAATGKATSEQRGNDSGKSAKPRRQRAQAR
ncbi:MAG TPA: ROK family protein [Bryobacteraceae bacterium]|nr:ROK family protein [Bryobacteraceae bacterium]